MDLTLYGSEQGDTVSVTSVEAPCATAVQTTAPPAPLISQLNVMATLADRDMNCARRDYLLGLAAHIRAGGNPYTGTSVRSYIGEAMIVLRSHGVHMAKAVQAE